MRDLIHEVSPEASLLLDDGCLFAVVLPELLLSATGGFDEDGRCDDRCLYRSDSLPEPSDYVDDERSSIFDGTVLRGA